MNTEVNIAGVKLKNPVMTASGTFGSGIEFSNFIDLNKLGGITTKGVANVPWAGNDVPRVAETYGGMLNAIGLQNPGIDVFCERDLPFLDLSLSDSSSFSTSFASLSTFSSISAISDSASTSFLITADSSAFSLSALILFSLESSKFPSFSSLSEKQPGLFVNLWVKPKRRCL